MRRQPRPAGRSCSPGADALGLALLAAELAIAPGKLSPLPAAAAAIAALARLLLARRAASRCLASPAAALADTRPAARYRISRLSLP